MAEVVVCGGSVIGLTAAMMAARDGHHVTVLEADANEPPPDPTQAWNGWNRKGVPQFHQPHNLFPRAREVMDHELPELTEALVDAGGAAMDPMASLPPTLSDRSPLPGDERFRYVNARRPVVEAVLAHAAAATDGVTIRRGVSVRGLRAEAANGRPAHVTGVHVDGDVLGADLVIDATGRRTKLPEWLRGLGPDPHVESEDSGFVYYTRYFRGPDRPPTLGPALMPMGSISILTLVGDNGTWSVTVFTASSDTALRPLKDPDRFAQVVRACPLQAHWLDGEPITGVEVMAGVLDRYRRYVIDGRPLATGIVPVGDAWACTNPSAGRGISIGLIHAQRLREAMRAGIDDDLEVHFDAATEEHVTPFYRNQIAADRVRVAQMEAIRNGEEPPPDDPMRAAVTAGMLVDPVLFRAALETIMCLGLPQEVFARPEVRGRLAPFAGQAPPPAPGPTRDELLEILA